MGLPVNCEVELYHKFPKGKNNLITDVKGVTVGQVTLKDDEKSIHTGVTAILPHQGNIFKEKVMAGSSVINGFGKSTGLVQVEELGTIETPIILTNTLSVGTATEALVRYMLEKNEDIGVTTGTVNCLITECNDGELNDIRGLHIKGEHVLEALNHTAEQFEEGSCGGGTGMICMGLKGGIGSSSRIVNFDDKDYTIGALVMSNFGIKGNLRIQGKKVTNDTCIPECAEASETAEQAENAEKEKGSVIIILATDLPLSERQLKRMAKRSTVSLARVGSFLGNGSGDIAIAFSTENKVPHYSEKKILPTAMLHDDAIDKVFEATAEAVEEAVISSLYHAETTVGIRGKKVYGLREFL